MNITGMSEVLDIVFTVFRRFHISKLPVYILLDWEGSQNSSILVYSFCRAGLVLMRNLKFVLHHLAPPGEEARWILDTTPPASPVDSVC